MTDDTFTPDVRTAVLGAVAERLLEAGDELNMADGIAGDGDLGITVSGAAKRLSELADEVGRLPADAALRRLGTEIATAVPSTFGTLVAVGLLAASRSPRPEAQETTVAAAARLVRAAADGISERGKATVGDKTMLDALVPAADALDEASRHGAALSEALALAAAAARRATESTRELSPKAGRARWLADRSRGHPDAGCLVISMVFEAASEALTGSPPGA